MYIRGLGAFKSACTKLCVLYTERDSIYVKRRSENGF